MAYEIHVPNACLYATNLALWAAGEAHGLELFGMRAVDTMRMARGFAHWKADMITEFGPFEAGLSRFMKFDKGGFIGKAALIKRQAAKPDGHAED